MIKTLHESRRGFLRGALGLGAVSALGVTAGCSQYLDNPQAVAPMIIDESIRTLAHFRRIADLKAIDNHIPDAAAVLILPRVVKGGFIGGAEAGTGVLLARTRDGWSYPAFYLMGAGSIGFQAGLQETEVIMIIRTPGALEAIIEHQGKFGADMGLMVGWEGIGYEASTTTSLGADILAFVGPGIGVYGGVSLEGAALVRRNDLNDVYYSVGATPREIVMDGRHVNPAADALRAAIDPR